jgi:hypothetical protein
MLRRDRAADYLLVPNNTRKNTLVVSVLLVVHHGILIALRHDYNNKNDTNDGRRLLSLGLVNLVPGYPQQRNINDYEDEDLVQYQKNKPLTKCSSR